MKEQFVTYEIALKLKELGFDEECFGRYEGTDYYLEKWNGVKLEPTHTTSQNTFSWQLASTPLWQQVIDWFREKHNIWIQIEMQYYDGITYTYTIIQNNGKVIKSEEEFHEYYEAREQAILKAIELCKKQ